VRLDEMITRAVEQQLGKHMDAAIDRALAKNPLLQFLKTMQMQMLGCDPTMDPLEAWRIAGETLRSYCEDEECHFGDPDHDWSREAAVTIIHEYELHHWDKP